MDQSGGSASRYSVIALHCVLPGSHAARIAHRHITCDLCLNEDLQTLAVTVHNNGS